MDTKVKNMILEYSLDRGETWIQKQPEENTLGTNHLVDGENTITVNGNSKHIMLRIINNPTELIDSYQEISDISIIYREKTLR